MRSIMVVAVIGLIAACSDNTTSASTTFNATLSSQKEVPPVSGSASGTAVCTVASPNISCTVTYAGLSGNPTASHIHTANANASGTVRVNLCGAGTAPACPAATSGTITSGAISVTTGGGATAPISYDSLVSLLHTYGAYVNIHTAANTGGEARGQLFVPVP